MEDSARKRYLGISAIAIGLLFSGCLTSGSFQTGRTLKPGKANMVMGFQQLATTNGSEVAFVPELAASVPRIGLNLGLPLRLELGAHAMLGQGFEFNLRHELTPDSFKPFDLAIAYVHGSQFDSNYRKYGLSVSRPLGEVELYSYYYKYQADMDRGDDWRENSDWMSSLIYGVRYELIDSANSIGVGVAIPLLPNFMRLMPELRYDFYSSDFGKDRVAYAGLCVALGPWEGAPKAASSSSPGRGPKGFRERP
jgi:hypothetical protein